MTKHELYNGEIKIHFNEKNHKYYLEEEDGKKKALTGVTTYINLDKSQVLMPWAVNITVDYIREKIKSIKDLQNKDSYQLLSEAKKESERVKKEAGDIGNKIHKWIEQYIKGEDPKMPEDERVLTGVNNFLDWVDKNDVRFVASERIVYSKKYGYVGTLDIIALIKGGIYVIDIKTGNGVYPEMMIQTAAYAKAYMEETREDIEGRIILRIDKNENNVEAVPLDEEEPTIESDFNAFLACFQLHKWSKFANKKLKQLRK